MTSDAIDRRVRRTQRAIFAAFRELVLSRPYDEIRVADVVERAGIGRSTFYEHYRNKDEVLVDSISVLFEPLADAVVGRPDDAQFAFVIDHFYEQRHFARVLLRDRPLRLLTDRLAQCLEARLGDELRARAGAAATLEVLNSWLTGRVGVEKARIAAMLTGLARSL